MSGSGLPLLVVQVIVCAEPSTRGTEELNPLIDMESGGSEIITIFLHRKSQHLYMYKVIIWANWPPIHYIIFE